MGKVRIYELARELKMESRKILEDARRLGVDASVASNTLDDVIADKIREMYFPKKEPVSAPRTARLVKRTTPTPTEVISEPSTVESAAPPVTPPVLVPPPAVVEPGPPPAPPVVSDSLKPRVVKLQPPPPVESPVVVEPEAPEAIVVPEEEPPVSAPTIVPEPVSEVVEVAPAPPVTAPVAPPPPPRPVAPVAPKPEEPKPAFTLRQLERPARPMPPPPPKPETPPVLKEVPPAPRGVQPPTRPGTTNVIRLAPPKPRLVPPPAPPGKRDEKTEKPKSPEGVHLLPSGAPQRTTYIPPKTDNKHKGRHSTRPKPATGEKQEGHQRFPLRKGPGVVAPPARAVPVELKPVRVMEGATVREFAERLDIKAKDVVQELFQRGVMATINQTMNPDVARDIGKNFGFDVSFGAFEDMIVESEFEITPEAMEDTEMRAPVVTVMGHVDHGKTSLLDAIRETRVAEGEAGGITQHIGAYSVQVSDPDKPEELRRIVFLDTPGHEAFTMMRARGARVTDLVILVVAADDGVMPQTVEAIEHSKAANVPIIVAINKIDKPEANIDRVKKELADRGLLWDGWGGSTTMVEVSAKKRQNLDGLLEMVILQADIMELKSNSKRLATGTVLEAKLDRGRGSVATVLIQNGTLKVGEPFIVGNFFGRVRALFDDRRQQLQETGPATPVEVLGLQGVPSAGDQFQVVADEVKARQISEYRQSKARIKALARTAARGLDQLAAQMETGEVKELLVILKADVQGSVEVLKDTLLKLSTEKVKVRIIRAGVGAITYDDVLLASASNATETGAATVIIGFNVRPETRADEVAKQEEVDIRLHSIIYKVEEEIRNAMIGMLDATIKETVLGKAEVRDVIRVPKIGAVAGSYVLDGFIKRTAKARLIRDNVVIFDTSIGSLRRFKDDVSEVQQGYECGITLDRFNDFKIGDVVEAYIEEKVAATSLN
ncbi:MAG: translation initiation factor IF-2 [Blastocatellia bacterium]|nr:translation initiation factor IF-2 [Blastocatellia bacterium]